MWPLLLLTLAAPPPVHRAERGPVDRWSPGGDPGGPSGPSEGSLADAAHLSGRGGADFWSRPEDAQAFAHDAVHARSVEVLELPGATHFLHLERPEHGRAALLHALERFLQPGS
jgi:pimeloyl-ACP methyl ester carboxylesterase